MVMTTLGSGVGGGGGADPAPPQPASTSIVKCDSTTRPLHAAKVGRNLGCLVVANAPRNLAAEFEMLRSVAGRDSSSARSAGTSDKACHTAACRGSPCLEWFFRSEEGEILRLLVARQRRRLGRVNSMLSKRLAKPHTAVHHSETERLVR